MILTYNGRYQSLTTVGGMGRGWSWVSTEAAATVGHTLILTTPAASDDGATFSSVQEGASFGGGVG